MSLRAKHDFFRACYADLIIEFAGYQTEKLGLNLRNRVAHGIYQSDFLNEKHSNHIVLILMILSLIKVNGDSD